MKKAMKHAAFILAMMTIVFLISFAIEDKTTYEYRLTYEEQPAVYVTKYGDCYHSIGCHYLSQSMIEIGLYEARNKGYRSCTYCGGISYYTTQVEHKEYYEVIDYGDAICYSCVRAIYITFVIYLVALWIMYENKKNGEDDVQTD